MRRVENLDLRRDSHRRASAMRVGGPRHRRVIARRWSTIGLALRSRRFRRRAPAVRLSVRSLVQFRLVVIHGETRRFTSPRASFPAPAARRWGARSPVVEITDRVWRSAGPTARAVERARPAVSGVGAVVRTTPASLGAPVLQIRKRYLTIQAGAARSKSVVVKQGTRLVTPRRRTHAAVQRPLIARPCGIGWRTSATARVRAMTRTAAGQRRRAAAGLRLPAIAGRPLGQVVEPRLEAMRKVLMVAGAQAAVRFREPVASARPAVPRLDYLRAHSGRTEAPTVPPSFAPGQRPTVAAGTARRAVQPVPDLERVVRGLHEQLTVRVERTVREQVQQRLGSRSRFTRGLADRIQSELYHDIVFERERLGLHGAS